MDGVLWYVLASSRGGETRVRILQALEERPRNANELANALDLDYTTVRHHLDVLLENNVLERTGDEYAAAYLFTDELEDNWDVVEEITRSVQSENAPGTDQSVDADETDDTGGPDDTGG